MSRKNVLLVFGGESSEHDVSVLSARNIYAAMDNQKYHVDLCYIDKHGKWWLLDEWKDNLHQHGGVQLVAALGMKSFVTLPGNNVLRPDVIFPALHGRNGEDGTVQGLFDLLHIPYVGCGVQASADCMDKEVTKVLVSQGGISVAPYIKVDYGESTSYKKAAEVLGSTLFVKPARSGSSVGISKVTNAHDFGLALESARQEDTKIIIEGAIDGRELEVAVLGNPPHQKASNVGEIVAGEEFYSYEDKYASDSKAVVLTSIEIDESVRSELRTQACKAYQLLGCRGLARVDFFLTRNGKIILNEINTLPGFTNISQYPKLWHEQGVKYPQLIDKLIELALQ